MPTDPDALTAAHVAVENVLIELRDERISVMGPANGFVVREYDGTDSPVMRLGTRDGLDIGIKAYLAALESRKLPSDETLRRAVDHLATLLPTHRGNHA